MLKAIFIDASKELTLDTCYHQIDVELVKNVNIFLFSIDGVTLKFF